MLGADLGNGTGRRTVTMATPPALTSGPVRYEAVLRGSGTSPVIFLFFYILATSKVRPGQVSTHGDFIVLPHWDTRPLQP